MEKSYGDLTITLKLMDSRTTLQFDRLEQEEELSVLVKSSIATEQLFPRFDERLKELHEDWEHVRKKDKFHNSLRFPEMREREEKLSKAHEGTYDWMLENDTGHIREVQSFLQWLHQSRDPFWIYRMPGAGKSTLMNHIINSSITRKALESWASPRDLAVLKFFFWIEGVLLQKTVPGLLRSILYQLFEHFPQLLDKAKVTIHDST